MRAVGGTVKNGQVVPDTPLPEGSRVEIFVADASPASASPPAPSSPPPPPSPPSALPTPGQASNSSSSAQFHPPEWYLKQPPLNGRIVTDNQAQNSGHAYLDGHPIPPHLNGNIPPHDNSGTGKAANLNGSGRDGEPGRDAEPDGWSWEAAIAQAPVSDWQLAREAREKAEAQAKALAQAKVHAEPVTALEVDKPKSRLKRYSVIGGLLGITALLLAANSYFKGSSGARQNPVKILKRTVKNRTVELTIGANTGAAGMQALSGEIRRSPRAREIVVYFGKPKTLLIYDRQSKSLASIPTVANNNSPCRSFVSGPFFNKVTDDIVHKVAHEGGGVNELSRFCGPPGNVDGSNCL